MESIISRVLNISTKFNTPNLKPMNFKDQLLEDIKLIQSEWGYLDENLEDDSYAFHYWILSRIFNEDESVIPTLITEYNDKGLDCFAHYPESKELHLIQNKFYDDDTFLKRPDFTDSVISPLQHLNNGNYKHKPLQRIFNQIKEDGDYKIFSHFFITNNSKKKSSDIDIAIAEFHKNPSIKLENTSISCSISYLDDLEQLYYGESYSNKVKFDYTLEADFVRNIMSISKENMPKMVNANYCLVPVAQIAITRLTPQEL